MGERRANYHRHVPPEILTEQEVQALLRTCSDTLLITVSLLPKSPNRRETKWVKRLTSPT